MCRLQSCELMFAFKSCDTTLNNTKIVLKVPQPTQNKYIRVKTHRPPPNRLYSIQIWTSLTKPCEYIRIGNAAKFAATRQKTVPEAVLRSEEEEQISRGQLQQHSGDLARQARP